MSYTFTSRRSCSGTGVRPFEHLGSEALPMRIIDSLVTEESVHLSYKALRTAPPKPG